MKIPTMKRLFKQRSVRRLAIGIGVLMAVTIGSTAQAQSSGLIKYLTQPASQGLMTPQQSGTIRNQGSDYRVLSASSANIRTAADSSRKSSSGLYGQSASRAGGFGSIGAAIEGKSNVQQVGFRSSCNSCGTACSGSCGGYSAGSMGRYVSGGGFACGAACNPYGFVTADALYLERQGDEDFTLSQNFGMAEDFDFEWGSRITVGYVPDCVHGCEFSFTGPIDWDMSGSLSSPGGGINTLLIPGLPVAAAQLSAFNDGTFQSQNYTADYWSLEANKTIIGWDVIKFLIGGRYIDYDENYAYYSQNTLGETGLLQSRTDNQLFGVQVGLDMLYPVGRFAYTDFRGRAGGYLNVADSSVNLANAGAVVLANGADDEEIAGVFELGIGYRYHLGQALTVRAGTEMWYLTGLATARDQVDQVVRPGTGNRVRMDDDIFFYGLTFSAQYRY